jgi:ABC-type Fe3+ transport system permease subunit
VFTLRHFQFDDGGASTYGGRAAYFNSLRMAFYTAVAGTTLTFAAAYVFEKLRPIPAARRAGYFLAVLPLGLPGLSLGVPAWRLCASVTVPWCAPTLLEVAMYLFVSAMTTVSALIFLYPGDLPLASVSVVHLDDAGLTQSAAAMCALILLTNLAARAVFEVATAWLNRRTRSWGGAP